MNQELPYEELVKQLEQHTPYSREELEKVEQERLQQVYNEKLEGVTDILMREYNFSEGSISFLLDKSLRLGEFAFLYEAMQTPNESFAERRGQKSRLEIMLDRGDSEEITTGRYNRHVDSFKEISSEQALVRGRMKFGIEYVIALAYELDVIALAHEVGLDSTDTSLVEKSFTPEEETKLRSIYKNFCTKDYIAAKLIERRTKHDIVAANTWITIRAQQLGLDDSLMRKITHFGRTSSDVNTNVTGELYMAAIGEWTSTLADLVSELEGKAKKYIDVTCIAQTHGQDAQLTTVGHIYANLAEQIKLHAKPLLQKDILKLDGKIAGAIGTEVDMKAAFPDIDFNPMYEDIVENIFGLNYVKLGNDQDCSNASLAQSLDTMVNVGFVMEKAATDVWIYASREILAKMTEEGESGSSAMPQKTNPFFAEGCEALIEILSGMINPIKKMLISYRGQGDLRRSITKREGFHPVMLSIIAMKRLIGELKKYEPNIVALEGEIYHSGLKVISSAINTYLREQGVPDAYDRIKELVMKPMVQPQEITDYINGIVQDKVINKDTATHVESMIYSVMDTNGYIDKFYKADPEKQEQLLKEITAVNKNEDRKALLGNAIVQTEQMIGNAGQTQALLRRYKKVA